MTTALPDVDVTSLPSLDEQVACEMLGACPEHGPGCLQPAVWRVRLHGAATPQDAIDLKCSNFTRLLCDDHLTEMREQFATWLRNLPSNAVVSCMCNKPIRQVSDLLLAVTPL